MKPTRAVFSLDATAIENAAKQLDWLHWDRLAGKTFNAALKKAGNAARSKIKREARAHRRTGAMQKTIDKKVSGYGMETTVRVKVASPVAHLIELGVKPHTIEFPFKNAKTNSKVMPIHAKGKNGPIVAYSRIVKHPGVHADPFFRRGVEAAWPDINRITTESAEDIARQMARKMGKK